jgi:hypothetical protein
MLDRIYPMLAAMHPTELLWRVKGHFDHLHLAMAGAGSGSYMPGMAGAVGLGGVRLRAPKSGLGGYPGAIADTAASLYAGGMSARLNDPASWGGWFRDGGSFTANRPTLFGAGEGFSPETVTVTPKGRGRGRPVVSIAQMTILNQKDGDIRRQVRRELAQAIDDLSNEIEVTPMVGAEELLA